MSTNAVTMRTVSFPFNRAPLEIEAGYWNTGGLKTRKLREDGEEPHILPWLPGSFIVFLLPVVVFST